LLRGTTLVGVLDIDSPTAARFDADDARGLEAVAAAFLASTPA
jgi:GAF domain-containing protein